MTTKQQLAELAKKVADLEATIKKMKEEKAGAKCLHQHFHTYPPAQYIPLPNSSPPPWQSPIWCGDGSDIRMGTGGTKTVTNATFPNKQ